MLYSLSPVSFSIFVSLSPSFSLSLSFNFPPILSLILTRCVIQFPHLSLFLHLSLSLSLLCRLMLHSLRWPHSCRTAYIYFSFSNTLNKRVHDHKAKIFLLLKRVQLKLNFRFIFTCRLKQLFQLNVVLLERLILKNYSFQIHFYWTGVSCFFSFLDLVSFFFLFFLRPYFSPPSSSACIVAVCSLECN